MIDRNELHSRFIEAYNLLLDKGLIHNRQQLSDILGKNYASICRAYNGVGRDLTMGFMQRLADAFPDVLNKDYLLNGEGDVEKQNGKPHIPFEAAAGGTAIAIGSVTLDQCEKFPVITKFPYYDFTIEARGDSMEPHILNGDILACRWCGLNTVITRPQRLYVLDTPEGVVVKHIKVSETFIICESANAKYNPFKIDVTDDMRFAIVVGVTRCFE